MLRRTPWRRVWGDARRTGGATHFSPWVRALRGCAGVYLIRSREDLTAIYVGRSRDIYHRLRRHFSMHKGGVPIIQREIAEARVYVLPLSLIAAAEERLLLMYPNALNRERPAGAPPF